MASPPTVSTDDPVTALERCLARAAPTDVAVAYAFGSHVEGRAHAESDVDVGVVFRRDRHPTAAGRFDAGVRLASLLIAELRTGAVDLVVLNDAPPGLAAHVATRGRPVYVGDAEAEHAFRRDAQLRAADVAPFLARARAVKLRALAR